MSKLESEQLEAFEDHLLLCAHCQDRVTKTDSFVRAMKVALAVPVADAVESRWSVGRFFMLPAPVWATGALAAACVAGFVATTHFTPEHPPLAIALSATRGDTVSTAQAGNALDLDLDVRDLSPAPGNPVQIVNADGLEAWAGRASSVNNGRMHAIVKTRLSAGHYYVRITDAAGAHREYALHIE